MVTNQRSPIQLIATKTQVPLPRHGLILRNELIERLSATSGGTLVLIKAPAGFGKSTLLSQWAESDPKRQFAWVSLDRSDNDAAVFWRYLVTALRGLEPQLAKETWGLLQGPTPSFQDRVIPSLLNALVKVRNPTVLVLDDYHFVQTAKIHGTVEMLLEHLPRTIQLVIASRTRPPLHVARLRAQRRVEEIGRDELAFSLHETRAAIGKFRRDVGSNDATLVHRRTEGWATGVYLAAMTNRAAPDWATRLSGRGGYVREYLISEVLRDLPGEDVDFLSRTSILGRLNGDLCDHVTGGADSARRLARFAESNLLIDALDAYGEWYRYHHLFQEFLQAELLSRAADEAVTLHMRAHEWFLANGRESEAIHHAFEAGDRTTAANLVCAYAVPFIVTGRLETAAQWLDRFSESEIAEYPPLVVASAWVAAFSGDTAATRRLASMADAARYDGPSPDGAASFESSVDLLLAALALDGVTEAFERAQRAYRLEPPDSPWRPMAAVLLGAAGVAVGHEDAEHALTEGSEAATSPDGVATYALGQLALLAASRGDWDLAEYHASEAANLIEELGVQDLPSSGAAYVAAAQVASHRRDVTEAQEHLRSVAALTHSLSDALPFDASQIHTVAAEVHLALGDARAALGHAQTAAAHLAVLKDGGTLGPRLESVLAELQANPPPPQSTNDHVSLTTREFQVLQLLPSELSLREVGHALFVSRNTTKTHTSSIYRKLGVNNRAAAVTRARELELI
jgi:LuxR family maltose regulon positive regulatory protein